MHTPGPWVDGKTSDSIIAREWPEGSFIASEDTLKYYGGHVICESVSPHNKPLIKAAPDMYEALVHISEYWNGDYNETAMTDALHEIESTAKAAIAKAEGK